MSLADVEADELRETEAGAQGEAVDQVVARVAGGRGEDCSDFTLGKSWRAEMGHGHKGATVGREVKVKSSRSDAEYLPVV